MHFEGYQFNPGFMKRNNLFSDCVSSKGQIFVNDHLQVTNINPLFDENQHKRVMKVFDNIFAIGDCCLTKVNEEKTVLPAKMSADICAKNINLMTDGVKDRLKSLPLRFPCAYGITLGKDKGILIINDYAKISRDAADTKLEY